jgi:NhaP-type Na+/H+ or K+/H+ antiporter
MLLFVGIYFTLPSPDEIIIHPLVSIILIDNFKMNLEQALVVSIFLYRSLGGALIGLSLLIGGRRALRALKRKLRRRKKEA